ncbi:MAG: sterol desaturase family protein [Myxococcota bacterium]
MDRLFKRAFGDEEPTRWGSGWVSGVLAVLCGFLALGGVLCFHFPELLTSPGLRSRYPVPLLRLLLQALLVLGLVFSLLSAYLRRRKVLALTGASLSLLAAGLGGGAVPLPQTVETEVGLGFDWFLINLFVLTVVFVPLERALPRDPDQLVFRPGWTTDGVHFLFSHLAVQLFTYLALTPVSALRDRLLPAELVEVGARLPVAVQVLAVLLLADLTQYWVHRAFHRVPLLWRFHAIHHSSATLDWLAGSRLHLLDALVTRTLALAPALFFGFSESALGYYLAFVSVHAVFIHSNFGARLQWLEPFVVTPRIHHFHHADEAEALDKNFAVHLPFLDRVFGTFFLPKERWPQKYGLGKGRTVPESWAGQIVAPFRSSPRRS